MIKTFITVVAFSLMSLSSWAQEIQSMDEFFKEANTFFNRYVEDGRVNYQSLVKNMTPLKRLTKFMESVDFTSGKPDKAVVKAFWINAYNIIAIKSVVGQYPIQSPLDDPDFFTGRKHKVAREFVTLDHIEKQKLMKKFRDPKVHFVLVCAAKGCPKLANFAYRPFPLEQQLVSQTKKALNDPEFIRVDTRNNRVEISQIFSWYEKDFVTDDTTAIDYINLFRENKIPKKYAPGYYKYDWSLNDRKE